jgi:hypothetical protein
MLQQCACFRTYYFRSEKQRMRLTAVRFKDIRQHRESLNLKDIRDKMHALNSGCSSRGLVRRDSGLVSSGGGLASASTNWLE